MSAPIVEELEFVKFKPGPEGSCQYADQKGAFLLAGAQMDHVVAQGGGTGTTFHPISFKFKGDLGQYVRFAKMVSNNDKTTTSFDYTSQHKIANKRKDKMKVTYEGLTFEGARKAPIPGEQDVMIILTVSYNKRKGKVSIYDEKGNAKPGEDIDDDIKKGEFK
jgi:hypothetical protein